LNKQLKEAEEEAKANAPATIKNVEKAPEAKANAPATINNVERH